MNRKDWHHFGFAEVYEIVAGRAYEIVSARGTFRIHVIKSVFGSEPWTVHFDRKYSDGERSYWVSDVPVSGPLCAQSPEEALRQGAYRLSKLGGSTPR